MRLILVNDVSIVRGGATKVALQCLEASRDAGLTCAILVGDDGEGLKPRFADIRTVALGERALREGPATVDILAKNYNRRAYEALEGLLLESDEETIVHVHGWSQILSPSIFHALARHRVKVIVTAHDFFLTCPNGGLINFRSGEVCDIKPLSLACLTTNCDKRSYLHKLWRFRRTLTQQGVGERFWSQVSIVLAHESMEALLRIGPFRHFTTLRTPTQPLTPAPVEAWRNRRTVFLGRMCWEKGGSDTGGRAQQDGQDGNADRAWAVASRDAAAVAALSCAWLAERRRGERDRWHSARFRHAVAHARALRPGRRRSTDVRHPRHRQQQRVDRGGGRGEWRWPGIR